MDTINQDMKSDLKCRNVKGALFLALLLLSAFLFVKTVSDIKAYSYIGGGVPASNVITVSGEGEIFAVPDVASFTFSVIEEAQTVEEAQKVASQKINTALELIKTAGVKESDIKTIAYNIYPRYEYTSGSCFGRDCPPRKRELVSYEVNQTISVKVRDTESAGGILADIGTVGVSNVSGLQFSIDDEEVLLQEARTLAIKDAKQKAKTLARNLDVKLVRVVSFNEGGNYRVFAQTFDEVKAENVGGEFIPNLPPGENKITSNVTITYEIR